MASTLLLLNIDSGNNSDTIITPVSPPPSNKKVGLLRHWSSQPLLRSKASVGLIPMHAQAKTYQQNNYHHHHKEEREQQRQEDEEGNDHHHHHEKPRSMNSLNTIAYAARKNHSSDLNRTQHKLMLQRQCFLADDKNYLNHPSNMKRLTKEIDRINREYNSICQHEINPMTESILRITTNYHTSSSTVHPLALSTPNHHHHHPSSSSSHHPWSSSLSSCSTSSSASSSLSSSGIVDSYFSLKATNHHHQKSPLLQRRASDFMLKRQDRRHSSISIHSAIIERSHLQHQQNQNQQQQLSKNQFFSRFFKSSLPPNQSNSRHSLLTW